MTLDSRRDYEMYVKHKVAAMTVSNKQKAIVRKLIMEGFDNGLALAKGNLRVEE